MAYQTALETPVHWQWDPDSRYPLPDPGSAPNNCGPTSVANIAHFYRDSHYGIYLTRRLAVSDPYRATTYGEQKAMLEARGVPNLIGQWPLSSIKKVIASGRQPMILGLNMARVPYDVAGHVFRGWHAVVALQNHVRNGESGVLIRDPNFNTTFRIDTTGGKRFYPDSVIQSAFVYADGWGLMPIKPKEIRTWQGRIVVRNVPASILRYPNPDSRWATARADGFTYRESDGKRLFRNSYQYHWNGGKRDGFYRVRTHSGEVRFIHESHARIVVPA